MEKGCPISINRSMVMGLKGYTIGTAIESVFKPTKKSMLLFIEDHFSEPRAKKECSSGPVEKINMVDLAHKAAGIEEVKP